MANFIIGKIIDSEGNDWGFRVFNMDDESYQDLVTKDVLSLFNNDGSSFAVLMLLDMKINQLSLVIMEFWKATYHILFADLIQF